MVSWMRSLMMVRVVAVTGLSIVCISVNFGAVAAAAPGHTKLRHLDNVDPIDLLDAPLDEDFLAKRAPFDAFARTLQEDTDGPTPSPTITSGGATFTTISPTSDMGTMSPTSDTGAMSSTLDRDFPPSGSSSFEIPDTTSIPVAATPSPSGFEIPEIITASPSSFEISAAPTVAPSSAGISMSPSAAPSSLGVSEIPTPSPISGAASTVATVSSVMISIAAVAVAAVATMVV